MILVDKEIKLRVQKDNLISGFNEKNLQAASYDVSVSNKLVKFKDTFRRISFSSKSDIDDIYEEVDISLGYDLRPNEYILVTLNEYITMPKDLCAHIRPRTSFIRLGLILSHQHLNPTYEGKLSLGLYNASPFVFELTLI